MCDNVTFRLLSKTMNNAKTISIVDGNSILFLESDTPHLLLMGSDLPKYTFLPKTPVFKMNIHDLEARLRTGEESLSEISKFQLS